MKGLYWIAINGSSCAMFGCPLIWPFNVLPVPEFLIGFPTLEEAIEAQQVCLESPADSLRGYAKEWLSRSGVAFHRFDNPEPQTYGPTVWESP